MKKDETLKTRGRPRQFDRDEALRRAMRLFWERGYAATSITDLGAATGLNPPSLYAAFGDKQRLFLEAVDRYQADHGAPDSALLNAGGTARAAIADMLRAAAKSFADPETPHGCMVVLSAQNCSAEASAVQSALREKRTETQRVFQRRLKQGQRDGDVPMTCDTAALARFAMTVLEGLSIQARDGASAKELTAVAQLGALAIPEIASGSPSRGRVKV